METTPQTDPHPQQTAERSQAAHGRSEGQSQALLDRSPVSVLACGGSLPMEVAKILRSKGREPNIVTIRGMADADFSDFTHRSVGIGEVGALIKALRANGAQDLMIAGHAHRPDLRRLRIDFGFVRNIFKMLALTRGGDDGLMRKIARFFEGHGFRVRGIAELTPELLTPTGVLAGPLNAEVRVSAETGLAIVHALGPFDVGQAVIIEAGRVLAIEGAEGTNGLIARQKNLCDKVAKLRVLVKAAKPGQDLRLDMPTIGPETITRCNEAGIGTVALEANRSLIVAQGETLEQATRCGITIVGLEAERPPAKSIPEGVKTIAPRLRSFARKRPGRLDQVNIAKGLRLLNVLAGHSSAKGIIVARENVLAINIAEPMTGFVERCAQLGQWGDQRRNKCVQTLVVPSGDSLLDAGLADSLAQSQIAGIVLAGETSEAALNTCIQLAHRNDLFLLSAA